MSKSTEEQHPPQESNETKPRRRWRLWLFWGGLSLLFLPVLSMMFLVDVFRITSSSMTPALERGDVILVDKRAYGLWAPWKQRKVLFGEGPKRGDVIVFAYPHDPNKAVVKRVIGLPGDVVRYGKRHLMINGQLIVHNRDGVHHYQAARFFPLHQAGWREEKGAVFEEELPGARVPGRPHRVMFDAHRHQGLRQLWFMGKKSFRGRRVRVKPGHVFVMGDNRDRSVDSRSWGLVPLAFIKGRVFRIAFARTPESGNRWRRFFARIK